MPRVFDTDEPMFDSDFDIHLSSFVKGCQEIVDHHFEENYPTLTSPELEFTTGQRYVKIAKHDRGIMSGTSVFAFIDQTNGDILKPAGWKAPAKHARGNIFDADNGLGKMTPYGPPYLR